MKPYPVWVEQIADTDKQDDVDSIVYGVAAKPDGKQCFFSGNLRTECRVSKMGSLSEAKCDEQ